MADFSYFRISFFSSSTFPFFNLTFCALAIVRESIARDTKKTFFNFICYLVLKLFRFICLVKITPNVRLNCVLMQFRFCCM